MAHKANGAEFHLNSTGSIGRSSHTAAIINPNTPNAEKSNTVPAIMTGVNASRFGMKDNPIIKGKAAVMTPTWPNKKSGTTSGTNLNTAYKFSPIKEKNTVQIANC